MRALAIVVGLVLLGFLVMRYVKRVYISPRQHRRHMERLDRENRELDELRERLQREREG